MVLPVTEKEEEDAEFEELSTMKNVKVRVTRKGQLQVIPINDNDSEEEVEEDSDESEEEVQPQPEDIQPKGKSKKHKKPSSPKSPSIQRKIKMEEEDEAAQATPKKRRKDKKTRSRASTGNVKVKIEPDDIPFHSETPGKKSKVSPKKRATELSNCPKASGRDSKGFRGKTPMQNSSKKKTGKVVNVSIKQETDDAPVPGKSGDKKINISKKTRKDSTPDLERLQSKKLKSHAFSASKLQNVEKGSAGKRHAKKRKLSV